MTSSTTTRFGVRTANGFRTNIVLVLIGKANALAMMQLLHHAVKDVATPLNVDDSDVKSPAYFFDLTIPVEGTTARAAIFGVKGMANAHLPALLASAHALVVVSDGADDPAPAGKTLSAKMMEARREEVYALRIGDSDQARAALVSVVEDLASRSQD